MEIGFYYLLIVLGLNLFFCIPYIWDKSSYGNTCYGIASDRFARLISWLNVIAGAIFVVGFLTLEIYNLI